MNLRTQLMVHRMVSNRLKGQPNRFLNKLDRLMKLDEQEVTPGLLSTITASAEGVDLDTLNSGNRVDLSAPLTRRVVGTLKKGKGATLRSRYKELSDWYIDLIVVMATLRDAKQRQSK